jgi:hypothetical protein
LNNYTNANKFVSRKNTYIHFQQNKVFFKFKNYYYMIWLGKWRNTLGRLCGLLVRVPGYKSRDIEFDSWRYQIFWEAVGLERGPLSLMSITEELLEWKSSGPGHPLSAKFGTNFTGNRRSLGRYSCLAD